MEEGQGAFNAPLVFDDVSSLAMAIVERHGAGALIGIDGWTGAGKTSLAKALASVIGGLCFDLDSVLEQQKPGVEAGKSGYVERLRLSDIKRALSGDGLRFVSGVCLRDALERAEISADTFVYVKRMAVWGWADELTLSGVVTGGGSLQQELRTYHDKWHPYETSDYIFERRG